MKKIILAVLGLLAISMFLVGCTKESVELVDEEGNMVGEAFKLATGKYQLKPVSTPSCIFVPADTSSEMNMDGNELCKANGYTSCSMGIMYRIMKYFTSSDKTCSGEVEDEVFFHEPAVCDRRGSNVVLSCITNQEVNNAEPLSGDMNDVMYLSGALCCK